MNARTSTVLQVVTVLLLAILAWQLTVLNANVSAMAREVNSDLFDLRKDLGGLCAIASGAKVAPGAILLQCSANN